MLSGFVYVDADGDGEREADEVGVPGAVIRLSGTDSSGQMVERSALSQNDGSYLFDQLEEGTYQLAEMQPHAVLDGLDSTTVSGATTGNDLMSDIVLGDDASFAENNFGEQSLRPEYFSIAWFFASAMPPQQMFREAVAMGEELAGDSELAASIRAGGEVPENTNASPAASDDAYSVNENAVLTIDAASGVLANDSDPDGDALTANLVKQAGNGSVMLNPDGSLTYTPNTNFSGIDSFTYQASDGAATSNVAAVAVTVTSATSHANTFTIHENSPPGTLVGQVASEGEPDAPVIFEIDDPNLADELKLAADDHLSGNPTASVVLIEYLDFQ